MNDREIVALYHARNEAAITETDRRYGRFCYAIAYRILFDEQDSEECVNDTWLRAWDAMPPAKPAVLAPFLAKITRNLSLDRYKQKHAAKRGGGQTEQALEELLECVASEDFSDAVIDRMEWTDLLNGFLADLSGKNRILFMQRYWHLLSVAEIASANRMKESAVKMSLARSREKLRERITAKGLL